jgi:RIO-like serine/threonine protein kinase
MRNSNKYARGRRIFRPDLPSARHPSTWLLYGDLPCDFSSFFADTPLVVQKFSTLYRNGPYLLKLIEPQKPADYFRKYHACQARREAEGSRTLAELGIRTPESYAYAFPLFPLSRHDSLFVMEWIDNCGTVSDFLRTTRKPSERRHILSRIVADIRTMIRHGVYHKDAHYGNILIREDHTICWIDNDISPIRSKQHIHRLLKRFLSNDLLEAGERETMRKEFENHL